MALEIERKFLVAEGFKPSATIFLTIYCIIFAIKITHL